MEERGVEFSCGGFLHAQFHVHAMLHQPGRAARGHGIGISSRDHHTRDAGGDEREGAGRCLAMMSARLEGDVDGGTASRVASSSERVDLGVRGAVSRVPSLTDNGTIANDDGADHGVRRRLSPSVRGERQRTAHEHLVMRRDRTLAIGHGYRLRRSPTEPYVIDRSARDEPMALNVFTVPPVTWPTSPTSLNSGRLSDASKK